MLLYSCITAVLFVALAFSVTDCRNNQALLKKRAFYFSKPIYTLFFICLILLFWFLTAFRDSTIGNDTQTYLNYYRDIRKTGVNPNYQIELGYQYFCLLLTKIHSSPFFLLIVCATICYTVCGIYIYKKSDNILFSTLLLFCLVFPFFASGIRQAIAMVIVLAAYYLIKDGKKILPICLILFASVFHISALLALLWFAHKYIPKSPWIIVTAAIVFSILAALGILNTILINILEEYAGYFESEHAGSGWVGITYYCLRALVFYIFAYIAYRKQKNEYSLATTNVIFLLATSCLGFSNNLFTRASLYFVLVTAIDLPNMFNSGKIKHRDVWMTVTGVVMLAYFLVTLIIRPEWNELYPYAFNWN